MWLQTQTIHHPKPDDPQQNIDNHIVEVVFGTEDDAEVVAGRLAIDYLDWTRTKFSSGDILQIADADSGGWEGLCAVTLDLHQSEPKIRDDFDVQDCVHGFGFIYEACFHSSLRPLQPFIIDAVCRMFPKESLIFTLDDCTDLSPTERAELGFRRVATTNYQFRPNMLRTEYDPSSDEPDSVTVPEDAEDYLDEYWL
ncbi:hypothetical protein [Allorhodopirellula solitaria]|uniref:N-acetyltransferase domain-containing protein n=1 Tax=Allorhodopirellula solitaria TaxID=2527987 RepID=A0A5C5XW03_9BACT|nr:hypothetical protein [Allorhodopirellula solitaria]TWT67507.1 hypothetical protein CA85_23580 [Allorhodopirellula solitaria]